MSDQNEQSVKNKRSKNSVSKKCIKCDKRLRDLTGQKKLIISELEANRYSYFIEKLVVVGDIICPKCRSFVEKQKSIEKRSTQVVNEISSTDNNQQPSPQALPLTGSSTTSQSFTNDPQYVEPRVKPFAAIETIELPFKRVIANVAAFVFRRKIGSLFYRLNLECKLL